MVCSICKMIKRLVDVNEMCCNNIGNKHNLRRKNIYITLVFTCKFDFYLPIAEG